jgi:hypothetical protein
MRSEERRTVAVVVQGRRYWIELDGLPIKPHFASVEEAIEVAGLVLRCEIGGDQEACAELGRRGVEPPVLKPDHDPIPDAVAAGV